GISNVFLGYAFGNRLRALELSTRIKVTAIFASSEIRPTFRTCAFQADFDWGRNDSATHSAAQNLLKTRHMHGARSISLLPFWGTGLRLPGPDHAVAAVVLISILSVFSFGHLSLTTSLLSVRLQGRLRV